MIITSPPTFPIRSLALSSALTSISPYVESLIPKNKMKYSFLFPIQVLRGYYSIQYFIQSNYSLVPSTHGFQIPKKCNNQLISGNMFVFVHRIISETIHSMKPVITLICFSWFGNSSVIPLCTNFVMTFLELYCLSEIHYTFNNDECKIYKQRLRRLWIYSIFPPLVKLYKKFVVIINLIKISY